MQKNRLKLTIRNVRMRKAYGTAKHNQRGQMRKFLTRAAMRDRACRTGENPCYTKNSYLDRDDHIRRIVIATPVGSVAAIHEVGAFSAVEGIVAGFAAHLIVAGSA